MDVVVKNELITS